MALLPQSQLLLLMLFLSSMFICTQTSDLVRLSKAGKSTQGPKEDARLSSRSSVGRRLAQDSWIDPFQDQLPGQGGASSLFKGWFKSKQQSELDLSAEEGRKRLEVVSAAMSKRAKALGKTSSASREDKPVSLVAAQAAAKLAIGGDAPGTGRRSAAKTTDDSKADDRNWKKKGGKMSPFDLAKNKMKKEKEDLYAEGLLEGPENAGESEFLIVEDPTWEEGIVDEFVRQYLKELQGDYEGLDDTMHFQIDRVESQIREYARAQADAVWKVWEDVVAEEKRKRGVLSKSRKSVGQSSSKETSGTT